jgi:hypothetical protein
MKCVVDGQFIYYGTNTARKLFRALRQVVHTCLRDTRGRIALAEERLSYLRFHVLPILICKRRVDSKRNLNNRKGMLN